MRSDVAFPPYELVDRGALRAAEVKARRLERLYHLTQEHAWDGPAVLRGLLDRHGAPAKDATPEERESLLQLLTILLWGELAAWNISADLALAIDDVDAKMAATGQAFDEARHFTVLREYVLALAAECERRGERSGPLPPLGGLARKLLRDVMVAPTLAKKLVGMQLLFETNAVVIFRRLADVKVCPVLTDLLPYFERDESRHVGLGVIYLPRLVQTMSRAEAASTAAFQTRCIALLAAGGMTFRPHFARLGMNQRQMAERVTGMQHDIVQQMIEAHGRAIGRAVLSPRGTPVGQRVLDFIHPPNGLDAAPAWHRALHGGLVRVSRAVDRALA